MAGKLSARQVQTATTNLFDGDGLWLKVSKKAKRWTYRYYLGKSREMGLGSYPALSLAAARAERDKWAKVRAEGRDPIAVREQQREAERRAADRTDPTLADAADITFEAKRASLRGEGKAGRWLSPIKMHVIPHIGNMRMSTIHQADIRDALAPIWHKMYPTAEKAIQRLHIIFDHMELSGVECDPRTVKKAQAMLGEVRHTPTLTPASRWQDIPAIYAHLCLDHSSHLALRFALLTAVRSAGIRGARFDEIDHDKHVWTVPAERVKGREGQVSDFRVPLSPEALEVIARAAAFRQGPYLFPGGQGGPVSEVAFNKTFKKADPNGTPHGLRTSFRTWAEEHDAAYDVAETALDHTFKRKVERSYARSDFLEKRRVLMTSWGAFASGRESENVVTLISGA